MVRALPVLLLAAMPMLAPMPPGTITQNVTAYLTGEGMSSRWHAVASKVYKGKTGTTPVYQWYLSIYRPAPATTSPLAFQSPGSSPLLSRVTKASGADMYFPVQNLSIVGAAELERATVQDVVVSTHEQGADCGMATIAILGASSNGAVKVRAQLQNYCDLSAKIVKDGNMQAVQLSGPYYAANSPVCCPAKPHATAMLRYRNGRWVETPQFFKIAH